MLTVNCIGNIGGDPEVRYSPDGSPVLRFNLAHNGKWKNREGEWEEYTEWLQVVVFGQRVDYLKDYLTKGMRIYVYGRLEARAWTDREGKARSGLSIVNADVEFVGPRQEGSGNRNDFEERSPGQASRPRQERNLADMPDDQLPF